MVREVLAGITVTLLGPQHADDSTERVHRDDDKGTLDVGPLLQHVTNATNQSDPAPDLKNIIP